MSNYIQNKRRQIQLGIAELPNDISIYFHKNNLMKIKKALGSKCTYISHGMYDKKEIQEFEVEGKDGRPIKRTRLIDKPKYYIVAKFKGTKKPLRAVLNGTPSDIKAEYYAQLKNDLVNAARKKGIISDS